MKNILSLLLLFPCALNAMDIASLNKELTTLLLNPIKNIKLVSKIIVAVDPESIESEMDDTVVFTRTTLYSLTPGSNNLFKIEKDESVDDNHLLPLKISIDNDDAVPTATVTASRYTVTTKPVRIDPVTQKIYVNYSSKAFHRNACIYPDVVSSTGKEIAAISLAGFSQDSPEEETCNSGLNLIELGFGESASLTITPMNAFNATEKHTSLNITAYNLSNGE